MQTEPEPLLAEVLSPSQVSLFLNCPAKWMFRYLLDLKDPRTAATAPLQDWSRKTRRKGRLNPKRDPQMTYQQMRTNRSCLKGAGKP